MRRSSLLFLGLFLFGHPVWAVDCGNSSLVRAVTPYYQADYRQGDLWPDFHFTQEPIILIDLAMNSCAHLFLNGELVKSVPLSQPWNKATYGFDFVVNPKVYPNYPGLNPSLGPQQAIDSKGVWRCCELVRGIQGDLNNILVEASLPYALVYWMNNKGVSYLASQISTMAHEIFHFFYQNRGLGGKPWPKPKFSSMQAHGVCYRQDAQVKAVFQRELNALVAAQQAGPVSEFIRLRGLRYSMVRGLNCGSMESVRESIEGTAQFIGTETIRRLGLMSDAEYLTYLKNNMSSAESTIPYYFIGLAELALIKHLQGSNFSSVAQSISKAGIPLQYVDVLEDSL